MTRAVMLAAGTAERMTSEISDVELVTVPELCKETWQVDMLDRERQRRLAAGSERARP